MVGNSFNQRSPSYVSVVVRAHDQSLIASLHKLLRLSSVRRAFR